MMNNSESILHQLWIIKFNYEYYETLALLLAHVNKIHKMYMRKSETERQKLQTH